MRAARIVGAAALAAGVLATGLTGCAPASIPTSGPLAVHPKPEGGMDALLEGTLRTDEGCIRIEHEGGVAMPSFPAGDASWNDDVLTWRDTAYVDGDTIALGGGFVSTAARSATGYVPEPCYGLETFVVSPFQ